MTVRTVVILKNRLWSLFVKWSEASLYVKVLFDSSGGPFLTVLKPPAPQFPHLSEEEVHEFEELFNLVDLDHGGSISPEELGSLMETLGVKPSPVRLQR